MPCPKDESGKQFGNVHVIKKLDRRSSEGRPLYFCRCNCGNLLLKSAEKLKQKRVLPLSCGCVKSKRHHPLWPIYNAMIQRCSNKNSPNYKNYGERGIKVCDRWRESFEDFCMDIGERPAKKYSIDRIDNNRGYSPENCRWVNKTIQGRNKRKIKGKWSSDYKGVSWVGKLGKWRVQITDEGAHFIIGYSCNEVEAAKMWDERARELGYEEGWLNFPKI